MIAIGAVIETAGNSPGNLINRVDESPRGFALLGAFVAEVLVVVLRPFARR